MRGHNAPRNIFSLTGFVLKILKFVAHSPTRAIEHFQDNKNRAIRLLAGFHLIALIIDHMGLNSSSRTNRITDIPAAIDQAIALAKYPNVSVKLSGAVGNSLEPYHLRLPTAALEFSRRKTRTEEGCR